MCIRSPLSAYVSVSFVYFWFAQERILMFRCCSFFAYVLGFDVDEPDTMLMLHASDGPRSKDNLQ